MGHECLCKQVGNEHDMYMSSFYPNTWQIRESGKALEAKRTNIAVRSAVDPPICASCSPSSIRIKAWTIPQSNTAHNDSHGNTDTHHFGYELFLSRSQWPEFNFRGWEVGMWQHVRKWGKGRLMVFGIGCTARPPLFLFNNSFGRQTVRFVCTASSVYLPHLGNFHGIVRSVFARYQMNLWSIDNNPKHPVCSRRQP